MAYDSVVLNKCIYTTSSTCIARRHSMCPVGGGGTPVPICTEKGSSMRSLHLSLGGLLLLVLWAVPAGAEIRFMRSQILNTNVDTSSQRTVQAIALVDLNGDKRADILAVDSFNDQLDVFLNDGSGNFSASPQLTYTVGTGLAITTGDFKRRRCARRRGRRRRRRLCGERAGRWERRLPQFPSLPG